MAGGGGGAAGGGGGAVGGGGGAVGGGGGGAAGGTGGGAAVDAGPIDPCRPYVNNPSGTVNWVRTIPLDGGLVGSAEVQVSAVDCRIHVVTRLDGQTVLSVFDPSGRAIGQSLVASGGQGGDPMGIASFGGQTAAFDAAPVPVVKVFTADGGFVTQAASVPFTPFLTTLHGGVVRLHGNRPDGGYAAYLFDTSNGAFLGSQGASNCAKAQVHRAALGVKQLELLAGTRLPGAGCAVGGAFDPDVLNDTFLAAVPSTSVGAWVLGAVTGGANVPLVGADGATVYFLARKNAAAFGVSQYPVLETGGFGAATSAGTLSAPNIEPRELVAFDAGYFLVGQVSAAGATLSGTTPIPHVGATDPFIARLTPVGDVVWVANVGGAADEVEVRATWLDGQVVVAGTCASAGLPLCPNALGVWVMSVTP